MIREVLLPYARAHLTIDHVAYTQWAIEQLLLGALTFVPMADATSFLLPTDPFDVLIRHLDSLNLKPYDERLISSNDAIQLIRSIFCPPPAPSELRSEQCWHDEDRTCESPGVLPVPALTLHYRRETSRTASSDVPCSHPTSEAGDTRTWLWESFAIHSTYHIFPQGVYSSRGCRRRGHCGPSSARSS
ncbi:hypothetical protein ID866_12765 [Astraeus odoratus]|nr:hypothetical protein ID866_12765 [Astraeus odoratus]